MPAAPVQKVMAILVKAVRFGAHVTAAARAVPVIPLTEVKVRSDRAVQPARVPTVTAPARAAAAIGAAAAVPATIPLSTTAAAAAVPAT